MGYYTHHSLKITEGDDGTDHKAAISELSDYDYCFDDQIKWYDCEDNMREYSKKYPDTVFSIEGEGEEAGDLWHAFYKNGKMQLCRAQVTFAPYDESELS